MNNSNKILFTCGDINGISPEISLKLFFVLLNKNLKYHLIYFCPSNLFQYYYSSLPLKFNFKYIKNVEESEQGILNIIKMPEVKMKIGFPTSQSGKCAYDSLAMAINELKNNNSSVLITAPVSKYAINLAGIKFTGQTELLADEFNVQNVLMMFLSKKMKAALHSTHIPINKVSSEITPNSLISKLNLLYSTLKKDFGIYNPSVAVLGLNPHAGENGEIGKEEKQIIIKTLNKLNFAKGPFVADAFFGNHYYKNFDAVYGMYHDQILIPFKMLNFSEGVNFTAGLPIIRTSPDHGTAFDIAGKNRADFSSLFSAFKFAIQINKIRQKIER
jgi:4-hydroxythreonine-4-phosphate dehydrogenase